MKMRLSFLSCLALTFLAGGTAPSPLQRADIQRDLASLAQRGFTYRLLDNDVIELTDPMSGEKHLRCLREPSEAQIRSWAAARGIPILEVDPSQVDTSVFEGWYTRFATVPLSNGPMDPLVVGDLDHNSKAETYGAYGSPSLSYESRCYEVDTAGLVTLRHTYAPLEAVASQIADADGDGFAEVLFTSGGLVRDYEQPGHDSLPTVFRFVHNEYAGGSSPGFTGMFVGDLDGDSLTDFLYKGSQPDSIQGDVTRVYVAEYDQQTSNFVRVWSTDYGFGGVAGIGGFAVDDFDRDGRQEFVACELFSGKVFVTENTGDNAYAVTWQDSTPFVNLYFTTSGDVDGDGKPEFFVGANLPNGNWTVAYEADSNNHFTARFMFHISPDGFFTPTYLATDVNGDGRPELVILSGGYTHVFKSYTDDRYRLWYFRHDNNIHSVQFYDMDGDGRKDLLVSKGVNDVGFFTEIYKASKLTGVVKHGSTTPQVLTLRSYPNPFNLVTKIEFSVSQKEAIKLRVFDVLGRLLSTLVDREVNPGRHTASWEAKSSASGLYFCRLETPNQILTTKIVLLK